MKLSNPENKKVLLFSLKKGFLIFQEIKFFKKCSFILERNFRAQKIKKLALRNCLIFRKMEL